MMVSHGTHHAAAHDVCQPNLVRAMLLGCATALTIGLANLWMREREYELDLARSSLSYAVTLKQCIERDEEEDADDNFELLTTLRSTLRRSLRRNPRRRLVVRRRYLRRAFFYCVGRPCNRLSRDCWRLSIHGLCNLGNKIKSVLLGAGTGAERIVEARDQSFARDLIVYFLKRHRNSSFVSRDNSTMDEAGGSDNAAACVNTMQGGA